VNICVILGIFRDKFSKNNFITCDLEKNQHLDQNTSYQESQRINGYQGFLDPKNSSKINK
jgi:hypothetical protein